MGYKYTYVESITGEELDNYLQNGYYRLNQRLISLDDYDTSLFWLRILVDKVKLESSQKRIINKARFFNMDIRDWYIDEEIENLWTEYKNYVTIDVTNTAREYLSKEEDCRHNIFYTKIITIKDGEKLIAVGYFDIGKDSIASILHFYDPAYKKYSLGKYLMFIEVDYAKTNHKKYYYTGYIDLYYTKFDYKLCIDKNATEVLLEHESMWIPWNNFGKFKEARTMFDELDDLFEII